MQQRSLLSSFITFSSLNILGMMGLSLYILADTYFVAKALGADGITALNLAIPIFSIIQGVGLMIGIGGASKWSMRKAQHHTEQANAIFYTAIVLGIGISLVFVGVGLFGANNLAQILGADASTFALTHVYLKVLLLFTPFFVLNNIFIAFVRNDHHPKLAMWAMLIGSFGNIILDYLFIFPLNMGMFGAVLATGLAPVISMCVLVLHRKHKQNTLCLQHKRIMFVGNIFQLGLSSFVIEISSAVILITFNLMILHLAGNHGVAAYAIVANLALVAMAMFNGLAQGSQPLTSQYYGKRDSPALSALHRYVTISALLIAGVLYLLIFAFYTPIITFFNGQGNQQVTNFAEQGLKIYFLGFFFAGFNIVTAMFLSTTERSPQAFILTISRGFLIMIPLVFLLSRYLQMIGVWLTFVLTELIVSILALILLRHHSSNKKR